MHRGGSYLWDSCLDLKNQLFKRGLERVHYSPGLKHNFVKSCRYLEQVQFSKEGLNGGEGGGGPFDG